MDIQKSMARMNKSMELDGRFRSAMMACVSGRNDAGLIKEFENLEAGFQTLLEDTESDEQLLTDQMLREKLADIKDWYARALEGNGRYKEAVIAFEEAADRFETAGKFNDAQKSRDKAGELKLDQGADFDEEIQRLIGRLEHVGSGTLDRIKVLISLGELHSKANDDFEAVKYLDQAEIELANLGGHPNDDDLLGDLTKTIGAIRSGQQVAGKSPIETSILRRALTQQLLLALGNAYRTIDPDRAAEYENRLRLLDDGKREDLRDLLGKYLDGGQDVQSFLQMIYKED